VAKEQPAEHSGRNGLLYGSDSGCFRIKTGALEIL
jgi:hypothetical protein